MHDSEFSNGDLLPDEVYVKLYVLRSPVVDRIPGHVHRGDAVAEDHCRQGDLAEEPAKEMSQPGALGDGVGDGTVLRFGA